MEASGQDSLKFFLIKKDYINALKCFKKNTDYRKASDNYNLACIYSLNNMSDTSLKYLKRAIDLGFSNTIVFVDDDLINLHTHSDWLTLVKVVKDKFYERNKHLPKIDIAFELDLIWHTDQGTRTNYSRVNGMLPNDTNRISEAKRKLEITDSNNLVKLEAILAKNGWPYISDVGSRGSLTAFLVIQHASPVIQRKYFPLLQDAIMKNEANKSLYPYMYDRLMLSENEKQLYGTQYYIDNNCIYLYPIEDSINVNFRRREYGLSTIEEYLKNIKH